MKITLAIFFITSVLLLGSFYYVPVAIVEAPADNEDVVAVVTPPRVEVAIEEKQEKVTIEEPVFVETSIPEVTDDEKLQALGKQLEEISKLVEDLQSGLEEIVVPQTYEELAAAKIHELTNRERVKEGLGPLLYDKKLEVIAMGHSNDMAERDYFKHESPEGCSITCRVDAANYKAWAWGENLAWQQANFTPTPKELAESFIEGWLNSPGHRDNMLRSSFTHEGVSVVRNGDQTYATVNFSKPR